MNCIVIDMKRMNKVISFSSQSIELQAGATLRTALETLIPLNLTTPVQTDYQGLSLGGFLSTTTGIGPASFIDSSVSQNVLQISVVTGKGEIVIASQNENVDLFNSARSGIGIFGVITLVKLKGFIILFILFTYFIFISVVPIVGSQFRLYFCTQNFTNFQNDLLNKMEKASSLFHQWEIFPRLTGRNNSKFLNLT